MHVFNSAHGQFTYEKYGCSLSCHVHITVSVRGKMHTGVFTPYYSEQLIEKQ